MLRTPVLILAAIALLGAAAAPKTKTVAPATLPHPVAMFLANLSADGKQRVTFKAAAIGTRFFFEEPTGVTVYGYDGDSGYRKETFLRGYTLAKALKKYGLGSGL